ncbi:MAG: Sorting nexin, cytoplasm-to-vacuole targeting pathway/endosomal sorting [Pleopsidium flavum]|nr:MAG: Sorting nexin, cytoplasm-to-vacuole targeting pathway/endosomal sorting [Pleopsidium flavum]
MWNDEDNNPYGSFDRHDSTTSEAANPSSPTSRFERPSTPTSTNSSTANNEPPEFVSRPQDLSDDYDDGDYPGRRRSGSVPRKKGVYDSRIEQILYENPDLPIIITDAGKNHESGGSYIVYTIRTGDLEVRRRYSEFSSLRATLVNLHPTLIIPPIPEKHSMADYAAKPTKAKEDMGIIDLRKRMLSVFLNRCRKMKEVREDGVWWRFLDPNASWGEVLHSHPVASIPKSNMKAPPLDPSNPTPAHNWLPVPSSSAKLKSASSTSSSGTPSSPPEHSTMASSAAHTIPGPQVFGRFPPTSQNLSEQDLDPYFVHFETSTRELELLLQSSIEKVNRRTLTHLSALSTDLAELGARYNGFSLSEQSPTLAAAIERIGQAVDSSYIATEELSASLGASFAEPMRESAQFAGVVRSVLRYRVLKRVQEEMTKDELAKKRALLESLERSEQEAKRIEQYLTSTGAPSSPPRPSPSSASVPSNPDQPAYIRQEGSNEDTASIDSDFPPTHSEAPSFSPSISQGNPHGNHEDKSATPSGHHHKSQSGNFVTNKIFGRISHAVHGIVDVDPERTRRDQIGKTRESLAHVAFPQVDLRTLKLTHAQLEQALEVSEKDVKDASAGVLKDLKRFQREKEEDLKRYMIAYARCHIDWAKKNLETWTEAKDEVDKIELILAASAQVLNARQAGSNSASGTTVDTGASNTLSGYRGQPTSQTDSNYDYIQNVCYPTNSSDFYDLNAPCNQFFVVQNDCTYKGNQSADENTPVASPQEQQKCFCRGMFWDYLSGCMDCQRLHGAPADGSWIPRTYISMASSSYCSSSATRGLNDFFGNFTKSISIDYGTSTGGVDVIGNKTDASLYYTASSSSSGAGTVTTTSGSSSMADSSKASAGSTGGSAAVLTAKGSNTASSSGATSTGTVTGTAAPAKATGNAATGLRGGGFFTVMLACVAYML